MTARRSCGAVNRIRSLPEDGAQRTGKSQPDAGIDGNLRDVIEGILDRVFDRRDVAFLAIEFLEHGIHQGGFSRARTAGAHDA